MNNSQNPVARKEKLVIQELPDEVLVYDLETNKAHCLNQTAAFVWKYCNGANSVADIVSQFEQKSGSRVQEDLIWLAIDQLSERNLLEKELPTKFAGESRRSVLKKIGLASMVALPVIASLTVPTAVMAAGCSGVVPPSSCPGCIGSRCNDDGTGQMPPRQGVCTAAGCVPG